MQGAVEIGEGIVIRVAVLDRNSGDTSFICWERKIEYSFSRVPDLIDSALTCITIPHSISRSMSDPRIAKIGLNRNGNLPPIAIHGGIAIQKMDEMQLIGYVTLKYRIDMRRL